MTQRYLLQTSINPLELSKSTRSYVLYEDATWLRHARLRYHEALSWLGSCNTTESKICPRWPYTNNTSKLIASPQPLVRRHSDIQGRTQEAACYNGPETAVFSELWLKRRRRRQPTQDGRRKQMCPWNVHDDENLGLLYYSWPKCQETKTSESLMHHQQRC